VSVDQNFANIRVQDGRLIAPHGRHGSSVDGLLDNAQLVEAMQERDKLTGEVKELQDRLKPLAPHLF
jgi:hypothetical protein